MEAKTQTTAGELKLGDRFYFVSDTKRIAYQVTTVNGRIRQYNIVNENGSLYYRNGQPIYRTSTAVVFLRHTNISS